MQSLSKNYVINASIENVWKGLTDVKTIEKWSGSRCVMSDQENTEFKLWDGDIWGKNTKVVKERVLEQEWYGGKWEKPSIVVFNLTSKKGATILSLIHHDIPQNEVESFNSGWEDYYIGPLKAVVESM